MEGIEGHSTQPECRIGVGKTFTSASYEVIIEEGRSNRKIMSVISFTREAKSIIKCFNVAKQ